MAAKSIKRTLRKCDAVVVTRRVIYACYLTQYYLLDPPVGQFPAIFVDLHLLIYFLHHFASNQFNNIAHSIHMNLSRGGPMATGVKVENVSPGELYEVMTAAASQDPTQVQASSKRLKQMLDMFGTFDALHEIAAQRTVPLAVRQQSIIQFKNAALNHWRSRKSAVK